MSTHEIVVLILFAVGLSALISAAFYCYARQADADEAIRLLTHQMRLLDYIADLDQRLSKMERTKCENHS